MTYEDVLSRFDVKTRRGNNAICKCPAHADDKASLSISRGKNGCTLIHCFAGCKPEDVLASVGLTMHDLFETDRQDQTGTDWKSSIEKWKSKKDGRTVTITDWYEYRDLSGSYAFTRIRFNPKDFAYGIRQSNGQMKLGLNGKKRKDIPAVYSADLDAFIKAVANGERVFYAEGEKNIKVLHANGYPCLTCGAAEDWNPECASLFTGADAVILADNDDAGRELVRKVRTDLNDVAKRVRVFMPAKEEHGDIADYLADHTPEDFERFLSTAPEAELQLDQFHMIDDKGRNKGAHHFAIYQYIKANHDIFVLGRVPYLYEGGVFRADPTGSKLQTMIRGLIYPTFIRSRTLKDIYDLFITDYDLQVTAEDLNAYPPHWINFANGFYDPIAKRMIPHDPKYRAINQIPHTYDPDREPDGTIIREWLKDICETDEDREMLLEYSGYCMTCDTRFQKFMILYGTGGSGKSTMINLLQKVVGSENYANISLSKLTSDRFAAYGLVGKVLNSCADLEITALTDGSMLKKVTGEDVIQAEPKGKDAFSFRSQAKLLFSTNELPYVKSERSNGFFRRILILTMNKTPEKVDPDFSRRLTEEIDDFIRECVHALERMYARDPVSITESDASREAVKVLRHRSDSVQAFLDDETVKEPSARTKRTILFERYEKYCAEENRTPLKKNGFFDAIRAKGYPERGKDGYPCFCGIAFSNEIQIIKGNSDGKSASEAAFDAQKSSFEAAEQLPETRQLAFEDLENADLIENPF